MQTCAKVSLMQKETKGRITLIDAANYLGIHPRTLRRWAKNGNFKLTRIGRRKYLEASEIRAFLAGELGSFKVKADRSQENVLDTTRLIPIPRAALCLGVHFTTIYRWVKVEKLHPITVGWQMYLTTEEVQALKARLDFKKGKHQAPRETSRLGFQSNSDS